MATIDKIDFPLSPELARLLHLVKAAKGSSKGPLTVSMALRMIYELAPAERMLIFKLPRLAKEIDEMRRARHEGRLARQRLDQEGKESGVSGSADVALCFTSLIKAEKKLVDGLLIHSTAAVFAELVGSLEKDPMLAFQFSPLKWEEIVAAAFDRAGYDEVILTPRSGDKGRDVIAIRRGVGSVKVLGSVKAYKPGHLVGHDHVREMIGVLTQEPDSSKGMIATTSDFAPRIASDANLQRFMPYRLELLNGKELLDWLAVLAKGPS